MTHPTPVPLDVCWRVTGTMLNSAIICRILVLYEVFAQEKDIPPGR